METSETRKKMTQILKEFTAAIAADKEMAEFCQGQECGLSLHGQGYGSGLPMSFVDGKVGAGLEAPPASRT